MNNIIMGNFFRSKRPQKNSKKRTSKRNISPQGRSYSLYFCLLTHNSEDNTRNISAIW